MLKYLIIALCMVALAYAECNTMQRIKVKHQWNEAFGHGHDRDAFNTEIWQYIFDHHPEAVDKFFTRVHGENIFSPQFRAHAARVAAGFDMTLSLMLDEPTLQSQLAHLKQQHIELEVTEEYFDVFREGLMRAVQHIIGHCYDGQAWQECTHMIDQGIMH